MDWATIKPGLISWVHMLTGLSSLKDAARPAVYWRDEPDQYRPPAYALLHAFGVYAKGRDGVRYDLIPEAGSVPEHLEPNTFGNRIFSLSVEIRCASQKHAQRADVYAERLRNRVVWPRSVAALHALNLAFIDAAPTVDLSALVDQRMESRCVVDFRFGTVIRDRDDSEAGRTGWFDKAELETTYEHGEDELVIGPEDYGATS